MPVKSVREDIAGKHRLNAGLANQNNKATVIALPCPSLARNHDTPHAHFPPAHYLLLRLNNAVG